MLVHRLRRWPNIDSPMYECIVCAGQLLPESICVTFVQCRSNVFDVGPTLYKCYTNVWLPLDSEACIPVWISTAVPPLLPPLSVWLAGSHSTQSHCNVVQTACDNRQTIELLLPKILYSVDVKRLRMANL